MQYGCIIIIGQQHYFLRIDRILNVCFNEGLPFECCQYLWPAILRNDRQPLSVFILLEEKAIFSALTLEQRGANVKPTA